MRALLRIFPICLAGLVAVTALAQPASTPAPKAPAETDELYEAGRQLFEQLAPPEVKEQFAFPTKEQWDAFLPRLQHALESDSLDELAAYAPDARTALTLLRATGGSEDLADWLEQRLDEIDAAQQLTGAPPTPARPPSPAPAPSPSPTPMPRSPTASASAAAPSATRIPHYDAWLARVRGRPLPSRATGLMPKLRAAFATEGVPGELAWLAEAESSLNPSARSPAGAKGLFQLMPDTAHALGLGTFLPDERTDPEKSARAAARYLRTLHGKFGTWPLALAAYNAGEGRVARTLASRRTKDYAAIADALPAETRMYVPKVCALIATRAGVPPEKIGAAR